MTVREQQTVYCPDALVRAARRKGMTNLSEFVRESLKEYIETGENAAKQNTPAATPSGGTV